VVLCYAGIALDHDTTLCRIAQEFFVLNLYVDFELCGNALDHDPALCHIALDIDPALCRVVGDQNDIALDQLIKL
jgi:hypothetical protein